MTDSRLMIASGLKPTPSSRVVFEPSTRGKPGDSYGAPPQTGHVVVPGPINTKLGVSELTTLSSAAADGGGNRKSNFKDEVQDELTKMGFGNPLTDDELRRANRRLPPGVDRRAMAALVGVNRLDDVLTKYIDTHDDNSQAIGLRSEVGQIADRVKAVKIYTEGTTVDLIVADLGALLAKVRGAGYL